MASSIQPNRVISRPITPNDECVISTFVLSGRHSMHTDHFFPHSIMWSGSSVSDILAYFWSFSLSFFDAMHRAIVHVSTHHVSTFSQLLMTIHHESSIYASDEATWRGCFVLLWKLTKITHRKTRFSLASINTVPDQGGDGWGNDMLIGRRIRLSSITVLAGYDRLELTVQSSSCYCLSPTRLWATICLSVVRLWPCDVLSPAV